MKKILFVILTVFLFAPVFGQEVVLNYLDTLHLAGKAIDAGNLSVAEKILDVLPEPDNAALGIEREYLRAQIVQKQGDYDSAIKIYRKLLDEYPDLVKVRYELALCYMNKQQWYRADYHLRLAMA